MGVPSLHSLISASIRSISRIAASNAAFTLASSAPEAVSSISVPITTLFLLNTSAAERGGVVREESIRRIKTVSLIIHYIFLRNTEYGMGIWFSEVKVAG